MIKTTDDVICSNIEFLNKSNRGLLAQNILAQLRNLLDYIAVKISSCSDGRKLSLTYEDIKSGNKYIKSNGKYKFIADFFRYLQISTSHYTFDPESSERLMLKYYDYLLRVKQFMKSEYNMDILRNLDKFPINQDPYLQEYYEKIAERIINPEFCNNYSSNDRYYIQNVRPFFVNNTIFYEVIFTNAVDNTSKFDRHIAFTKHEIMPNYAVKLSGNKCRFTHAEEIACGTLVTRKISALPAGADTD